jgi:hypothetical protein
MKTMTALGSGTVPLPPDPPPMTDWGMRLGEEKTVEIDGVQMTVSCGTWQGIQFVESKGLP